MLYFYDSFVWFIWLSYPPGALVQKEKIDQVFREQKWENEWVREISLWLLYTLIIFHHISISFSLHQFVTRSAASENITSNLLHNLIRAALVVVIIILIRSAHKRMLILMLIMIIKLTETLMMMMMLVVLFITLVSSIHFVQCL